MRLRTLLALTVVLVLGMASPAAAQTVETSTITFIHEVTGFGPLAVAISFPGDPSGLAYFATLEELQDATITVGERPDYTLTVARADALDEPLAVLEGLQVVAGNAYVVRAFPQGDGIGFDVYESDPTAPGNLLIEHRTGRSETFLVNVRRGDDFSDQFELGPGAVHDYDDTNLPPGRYALEVSSADGRPLAALDNLPVVANQTTVVTIVADGEGIELRVAGPGPSPAPSAAPSPTAVRTPSRIETGAGGTVPETAELPEAALLAVGLLALAAAVATLTARVSQDR